MYWTAGVKSWRRFVFGWSSERMWKLDVKITLVNRDTALMKNNHNTY